jgi:hypothetical protein
VNVIPLPSHDARTEGEALKLAALALLAAHREVYVRRARRALLLRLLAAGTADDVRGAAAGRRYPLNVVQQEQPGVEGVGPHHRSSRLRSDGSQRGARPARDATPIQRSLWD